MRWPGESPNVSHFISSQIEETKRDGLGLKALEKPNGEMFMREDLNRDKREEEIRQRSIPQGLKPNTHFVAFAWLKPCPCYNTASSLGFSPSCKSRALIDRRNPKILLYSFGAK